MGSEPPSEPGLGRKVDRRLLLRGALGAGAAAAVAIPAVRLLTPAAAAEPLTVGGLAVTCNLTLPVACAANDAANPFGTSDAAQLAFGYRKYSGWPELKESLMSGDLQAAYMLAPMVMDLADKNLPVKIVSIGHRSGAVIMVHAESPYRRFRDLAGKRIAIPSRFAVDFLFLRQMLAHENMTVDDVEIVEMAPADMPAALYVKGVDAYCTGEPFGAAAERAGYARVLRMTRDEWPRYMCCVLTVREELIAANRPLVQNLVDYVLAAGRWLDGQPQNREKAVQIAAGPQYFNQDPEILRFVMGHPTDRVTYGDLRMVPREFDELMQQAVDAGALSRPVPFAKYVDESFARGAARVDRALTVGSRAKLASAALLAVLLAGAGIAFFARDAGQPQAMQAGAFDPPHAAPEFSLRGSDGSEVTLARYRGKVVLLSFGFTSCAAVCPTTLATLAQARKSLGEKAGAVQVIFVTVDPERDDAAHMREYLAAFDRGFIGATGAPEALAEVREDYGVTAVRQGTGPDYAMAHTSSIFLIDRAGKLRAVMPFGHDAADFVHDIALL